MARQQRETAQMMKHSSPTETEPGLHMPPRVLLAEDQPEMRNLLRTALERDGYEVIEVEDGPSLIRALISGLLAEQTREPDLIITDVRMPGFTGMEVLARLRREKWLTPVILITAFGDEGLHAEAARLGAALVLDKPFELDDLRAAVRGLIRPH